MNQPAGDPFERTTDKQVPACPECRSTEVFRDATARWDPNANHNAGGWIVTTIHEAHTCGECYMEFPKPHWV